MFIDTHCHLFVDKFDDDRDQVIQQAYESGVSHILLPAIDKSSEKAMNACTSDIVHIHNMTGIHPCDVQNDAVITEEELAEWAKRMNAKGIGESGLDYYWSTEHIEEQKQSLKVHFEVAKALDLPLSLHNREATEDFLNMIEEAQDGRLKGVWHCFNGSVDEGKRAIDAGFYLGIGGVATFKNGGMDKVLPHLPLEKMVLETDAPYLAPTPHRGKRNEPSFIPVIAAKLAIYFETLDQNIADITTQNAKKVFNI